MTLRPALDSSTTPVKVSPSAMTSVTIAWNRIRTPAVSSRLSATSRQTSGSWVTVNVLPYSCGAVSPPRLARACRKRSVNP
jgi:hypothetical protein